MLASSKGFSKYAVIISVIFYASAYTVIHKAFSSQEKSWVAVAKAVPVEPNTKTLSDQVDALSTRINILEKMKGIQGENLQGKYVKGLIESEAEKQAKEIVKDKTDQLKGELFGQISFPILAAIVSIFTAFVVKDAVLELLKKDEKDKLIEELNLKVEKQNEELNEKFALGENRLTKKFEEKQKSLKEIIEKYIKKDMESNLQSIKARVSWLEYFHSSLESKSLLDNSDSSYIKSIVTERRSLMINTIGRLKDIVQDPDSFKMIDAYEKTLLLTFARKHKISEDISSILTAKDSQYNNSEQKSWLDYHVDIRATQLRQMIDDLHKFNAISEVEKNDLLDILSRYNSKIDNVVNVRQDLEDVLPALEAMQETIPSHMRAK